MWTRKEPKKKNIYIYIYISLTWFYLKDANKSGHRFTSLTTFLISTRRIIGGDTYNYKATTIMNSYNLLGVDLRLIHL